eukprot:222839-Rhodomonas_salina.2
MIGKQPWPESYPPHSQTSGRESWSGDSGISFSDQLSRAIQVGHGQPAAADTSRAVQKAQTHSGVTLSQRILRAAGRRATALAFRDQGGARGLLGPLPCTCALTRVSSLHSSTGIRFALEPCTSSRIASRTRIVDLHDDAHDVARSPVVIRFTCGAHSPKSNSTYSENGRN